MVVVGAGIAGLTVARLLVAAGVDVVVLEGRDRVGGRLLSTAGGLDLGASWFWPGETHVADLVAELGVAVHPQHLEGDAVYHSPDGPQRLAGNPLDQPSSRFSDGADRLALAVAAALPAGVVQLGRPVTSVRAQAEEVVVDTADGAVSAGQVVLAVPPALVASRIRVQPPLPPELAQLAASTPVWMGGTTKVVVRYDRAFWRQAGLSGSGISHLGPLRELHDLSGPDGDPAALFGFAAAPPDRRAVVDQLVQMFGAAAATPTDVVVQDWASEEWTSPPGVRDLSRYELFGHPLYDQPCLDGRLHWASTETAPRAAGHIEGALAAAHRAAAAVRTG